MIGVHFLAEKKNLFYHIPVYSDVLVVSIRLCEFS